MSSVSGPPGARLARRLRDLRDREWPDITVTQAQLATALSAQRAVGPAAVSTWENAVNPKTPTMERLSAYARFFATRRSMEGGRPRLLAVADLDDDERDQFERLEHELFELHTPQEDDGRRLLLHFADTGPIVIVCPEAPKESRGPLADADDPNHTRLHRFADADALIEVFGHIRALNPDRQVLRRLPSDTRKSDLSNHLVLLGGIGWNSTLRRVQMQMRAGLPIEQFEHTDWPDGEVFRLRGEEHKNDPYVPRFDTYEGVREMTEDVGLIARLRNPFNTNRTLTIFNGVHSTGVLGAVLAVTDETVRPTNETYLADRYPRGEFTMLIRVPIVEGDALAPDLTNPDVRRFEWAPEPAEG